MEIKEDSMNLFTPSTLWEATDEELRSLIAAARNELILRHMDKPVTAGWLTDEIPQFADLEQEFGLRDTPMATEVYGG